MTLATASKIAYLAKNENRVSSIRRLINAISAVTVLLAIFAVSFLFPSHQHPLYDTLIISFYYFSLATQLVIFYIQRRVKATMAALRAPRLSSVPSSAPLVAASFNQLYSPPLKTLSDDPYNIALVQILASEVHQSYNVFYGDPSVRLSVVLPKHSSPCERYQIRPLSQDDMGDFVYLLYLPESYRSLFRLFMEQSSSVSEMIHDAAELIRSFTPDQCLLATEVADRMVTSHSYTALSHLSDTSLADSALTPTPIERLRFIVTTVIK